LKLLFDENLAARLVNLLVDVYPESTHVDAVGLRGAPDRTLWDRARAERFVLVTKDGDFHRLSVFLGPPPKVVWLRLGNCATSEVARLLREQSAAIHAFVDDDEAAFLTIG
jgi:predicted nuclease of predicted toxin-antitoxin system